MSSAHLTSRSRAVHAAGARLVRARLRRAHARAGAGLAGHRRRRTRADLGADRLGQDAGRLSVGARPLRGRRRRAPPDRRASAALRLVYISPLKALGYDVERNLRAPLRGIGADVRVGGAHRRHAAARAPRHAARTRPTCSSPRPSRSTSCSPRRRASCSTARSGSSSTRSTPWRRPSAARTWRVTLERLAEQAGRDVQRIGLSATQRPLDEVARFLVGPARDCAIVDAGVSKPLDLRIHVPVESMVEPDVPARARQRAGRRGHAALDLAGDLPRAAPARARAPLHARLREQPARRRAHRAAPERPRRAGRRATSGRAARDIARAHHGSLAREERLVIEDLLKAGELPCLVATSSLELGIDMGAIDLVVQVESPKSVTRGLQRIGRAGHGVGEVSRGRIFPKFRADLLECAVVARAHARGADRGHGRAAQPARRARPAGGGHRRRGRRRGRDRRRPARAASGAPGPTPTSSGASSRTCSTCSTAATRRRSSASCARASCGTAWRARSAPASGARALAVANAGTIPDRGLFSVNLPDGRARRRARRGDGLRGARRPDVPAGRHLVAHRADHPRPRGRHAGAGRARAPCRSGTATGWAGPASSARPSAPSARWAVAARGRALQRRLRPGRARRAQPARLLARAAGGHGRGALGPHGRGRALPRRDRRLAAVRAHALRRARARRLGAGPDARASATPSASSRTPSGRTTASSSTCPTPTSRPAPSSSWSSPTRSEDLVVAELGAQRAVRRALSRERGARPAHTACLPRAAHAAVAAASEGAVAAGGGAPLPAVPDRPRDLPRVPARRARPARARRRCCARLHTRELSLVRSRRRRPRRSPRRCCSTTSPRTCTRATRRPPSAAPLALALDRDLLRELLGQEELRDLIDPAALEQVEDDLQQRSPHLRARERR